MDQRSRNRHREHDEHGLIETDLTSVLQPDRSYFRCLCGWFGWLDKN